MVPIIPIDLNVTLNTSVCSDCSTTYKDINNFFLQITQGTNKGVCMDIVDSVRRNLVFFLRYFIVLFFSR